jgi:hypothetical protein
VTSTNGYVLDSKQIYEQLYDDLDSFSEISQDTEIDVTEHNGLDATVNMWGSLTVHISYFPICSTTKRILLAWVKEI